MNANIPEHKQRLLAKLTARTESYLRESAAGAKLVTDLRNAIDGNQRSMAYLKEAVASTDFPMLFGQVTQIAMQGQYARLPQQWTAWSSRYVVSNLKNQRVMDWNITRDQLLLTNGGDARHDMALPRVPELTEYPTFSLESRGQEWGIQKFGARFPFSFEAFLNDEFQVIQDMPGEMAAMGSDTEDVLTTSVIADATGPNLAYFNTSWDFGTQADAGNILDGNPELSVEALELAMQQIGLRQVNGRQVTVPNGWVLVVPPALSIRANEIAAIDREEIVEGDPLTGRQRRFMRSNQARGRFEVQVNQWLPLIDTSVTSATTWYLLPKGGTTGTRRAIITGFLAGHEAPELRVNNDTGSNIGGGDISPFEGSFSHDDVQYRVRHFCGASGIDPSPSMASRGTNTDS